MAGADHAGFLAVIHVEPAFGQVAGRVLGDLHRPCHDLRSGAEKGLGVLARQHRLGRKLTE